MSEHSARYISVEGDEDVSAGVLTTSDDSPGLVGVMTTFVGRKNISWLRWCAEDDDGESRQVGLTPDGERVYDPEFSPLGHIVIEIERDTDGTILVHDDATVAYGVGEDLQEALYMWGCDIRARSAAQASWDNPNSLREMGYSDRDRLMEESTWWSRLRGRLITARYRVLDLLEGISQES